jgi:hypothetical protein
MDCCPGNWCRWTLERQCLSAATSPILTGCWHTRTHYFVTSWRENDVRLLLLDWLYCAVDRWPRFEEMIIFIALFCSSAWPQTRRMRIFFIRFDHGPLVEHRVRPQALGSDRLVPLRMETSSPWDKLYVKRLARATQHGDHSRCWAETSSRLLFDISHFELLFLGDMLNCSMDWLLFCSFRSLWRSWANHFHSATRWSSSVETLAIIAL